MNWELPFKKQILEAFLKHFQVERAALVASAKAAHSAATHEESRAEDRHDTFAIEASYLAAGQAARVSELEKCETEFSAYLENLVAFTTAECGALLQLSCLGKLSTSFIANNGGGTQIQFQGIQINIVSPVSPLGEQILGLQVNDEFTVESKTGDRNYTLVKVI